MTDASNNKETSDDDKKRMRERVEKLLLQPASSGSGQVALASGKTLRYTSSAGFVPVVANMSDTHKGEPDAALFMTSYCLEPATAPAQRPILFSFNGGPGSSSVWLHLGALGPKHVPINDD